MAKQKEDIKVKVVFTEGYEKRYTEVCLKVLAAREKKGILNPPGIPGQPIQKPSEGTFAE